MTEAEVCITALDQAIAYVGEPLTFQKIAVDGDGAETVTLEVSCNGNVRASIPQDLESSDVTDIEVIVSPTGLAAFGVPTRDDRLVLGVSGKICNMIEIAPIYVMGVLVRVNLKCRG